MKDLIDIDRILKETENEPEMFSEVFFQVPGVIRFEKCDPVQVLGQITRGEELRPTCPDCGRPLLGNGVRREGFIFKKCSCSG